MSLIQSRLVYCKTRGALTTTTIGKDGFQSKQWIGCRPNHSVAYALKVGVRGNSGLAKDESRDLQYTSLDCIFLLIGQNFHFLSIF